MSETATAAQTGFLAQHAAWHEGVEARRTSPYGPLSVTALHWLTPEPQRFESVPGTWSAERDGTVVVELDESDDVRLEGGLVRGTTRIGPLTGIQSATLEQGDTRIEVAARGGSIALRSRHPESADRTGYRGTATFPADPAWVVPARFVAEPQESVRVDTVIDDLSQEYASPGVAEFEVDGKALRLVLFPGAGENGLRAIFADETGRDLTFPASRSVEVVRTGPHDLVIDFNRATNPPCAYSAGATCPLPPPGNRLPVRIEAGELRPGISALPDA